jgi:DNA-binding CsgD family transcriptional regulator
LHAELRKLGLQSSVALRALDQLAAGVIVTQGDRRVIELNRAAEEIIRRNDGLGIRKGKLRASRLRGHETRSADRRCDPARKTSAKPGRMLIGRPSGGLAYIVTAASLGVSLAVLDHPLAMVLVAGPEEGSLSVHDLSDLFGLSAAESRLALTLIKGKKLRDIADDTGLRITTLRTQLSSIQKKIGAERQVDLIRILSRIPVVGR